MDFLLSIFLFLGGYIKMYIDKTLLRSGGGVVVYNKTNKMNVITKK